ncbi:hypothetical protein MHB77_32385 [Paenibacillus sp. FSL K6-3166]|uniref:hypothetical protein n=1 Tax=unclassified Paenibacillus TaxID=185978 RepID=UPI000BA0EFD2|nr:hypothetical protein [Paenibacillus sp. VTT E-133291]OZQ84697.1 hypothetical protein CA598_23170 [Paenibacillus sp. VTT E-133291]
MIVLNIYLTVGLLIALAFAIYGEVEDERLHDISVRIVILVFITLFWLPALVFGGIGVSLKRGSRK